MSRPVITVATPYRLHTRRVSPHQTQAIKRGKFPCSAMMNYSWEPVQLTKHSEPCNLFDSFEGLCILSAGPDIAGMGRTWMIVSLLINESVTSLLSQSLRGVSERH